MSKKVLIFAFAALLVVAFSATAMAAPKVDFSGTFRVRAFYNNNFTLNGKEAWESKRSYLDQRLRINLKLMPTDKLTLNLGLTTEDATWGRQGTANFNGRPVGFQAGVTSDPETNFELRYFWATIKSPFGQFDVGRQPVFTGGLAQLGYFGSDVMGVSPFDNSDLYSADMFSWTYNMGAFSLNFFYEKKHDVDTGTGEGALNYSLAQTTANTGARKYDQDWDQFAITPTYKFANGGVTLTISYDKIKSPNIGGYLDQNSPSVWGSVIANNYWRGLIANTSARNQIDATTDIDAYYWMLNPAVVLNFGPVGLHAEMAYLTGNVKWRNRAGAATSATTLYGNTNEVKDNANISGFGLYLDATYNFGPGMVGLAYTYVSGDKSSTDYNFDGFLPECGIGYDHAPLLIVYDRWLNPWRDHGNLTVGGINPNATYTTIGLNNFWSLLGWVDYSVTEDLTLHAALGYLQVNEAGKNLATNRDISKNFGTEFDVSLVYKIMPNLTYQLDLGYFWGGDYFKQGWDENDAAIRNTPMSNVAKVGNAYSMKNTLKLSF